MLLNIIIVLLYVVIVRLYEIRASAQIPLEATQKADDLSIGLRDMTIMHRKYCNITATTTIIIRKCSDRKYGNYMYDRTALTDRVVYLWVTYLGLEVRDTSLVYCNASICPNLHSLQWPIQKKLKEGLTSIKCVWL